MTRGAAAAATRKRCSVADAVKPSARPAAAPPGAVRTWAEMIKLSHSVFALPFAVLATFLAARSLRPPRLPGVVELLLIVICMVGARSAAMTFNRLVDADIDARNPRTAIRALPRGLISRRAAWLFFLASCGVFLLGCGEFWFFAGNAWPLALGLPVLAVLCVYSLTKRFTRYSHAILGAAIALAPVAAWIAIAPATLGAPAWLLMLVVTCWIGGFDVIYACQDADFDRDARLYSIPSRLGIGPALWIARIMHTLAVAALIATGWTAGLTLPYWIGVGCAALLLAIENAIVSPRDLSRVNLAFFTVNGVVGLVLGALGVLDVCMQVLNH